MLTRRLLPALSAAALATVTATGAVSTATTVGAATMVVPRPSVMITPRRFCSTSHTAAASAPTAGAKPPRRGNFFAFFDLPKQPVVDGALLQSRYHALQLQVHPDRANVVAMEKEEAQARQSSDAADADGPRGTATCGDPVTRPAYHEELSGSGGAGAASSIDTSTYANAAYETLKDPFFRCRYLARLVKAQQMKNREVNSDSTGKDGGDGEAKAAPTAPLELTPREEEELIIEDDRRAMLTRIASPNRPLSEDFLMELLKMNELIFGGDQNDANVLAQMKVLHADLKERNAQYFDDVNAAWEAQDMDEFFGLVEEWTYIHNALTHLINRL